MIDHKAMTDAAIERTVELQMNRLDRALLNGDLTQANYDAKVHDLDKWASQQYRRAVVAKAILVYKDQQK